MEFFFYRRKFIDCLQGVIVVQKQRKSRGRLKPNQEQGLALQWFNPIDKSPRLNIKWATRTICPF